MLVAVALARWFVVPAVIVVAVGVGALVLARWRGQRLLALAPGPPEWGRPSWSTVADWAGVVVAVVTVMALSGAYGEVPVGGDSWGHLAKMHLLAQDWPQVAWNSSWYSGTPYFAGSYPPGYHLGVMALGRLAGISDARAVMVVSSASLVVIIGSAGHLARVVTGARRAGRLAIAFTFGAGVLWSHPLNSGLNPRLTAMAGVMVGIVGCVHLVASGERRWWLVAVAGGTAAAACHLFIAGVGLMAMVGVLCIGRRGSSRTRRGVQCALVAVPCVAINAYFYVPMLRFTGAGNQVSTAGQAAPWSTLVVSERVGRQWILQGMPSGLALVGAVVVAIIAVKVRGSRGPGEILTAHLTLSAMHSSGAGSAAGTTLGVTRRSRRSPFPAPVAEPLPRRPPLPSGPWHVVDPDPEPLLPDGPVRLLVALAPMVTACLVYAYADHLVEFGYFVMGMFAIDILIVPAVLGSVMVAIGVELAVPKLSRVGASWLVGGVGLMAVASVVWLVPQLPAATVRNRPSDLAAITTNLPDLSSGQYRVAGMGEPATKPLNLAGPIPQTRGYQANAVIRADEQYLIETATAVGSEPFRRALFDWWSVGWVLAVGEQATGYRDYPSWYQPTVQPAPSALQWFEVADPRPLVWSGAVPVLVVVGDGATQLRVLRTLVGADVRPQQVMVLRGPATVGGLDERWLEVADVVLVDGGAVEGKPSKWSALSRWVKDGGALYVEQSTGASGDDYESAPDLLPIEAFKVDVVEADWGFDQVQLGSFDLAELAPPLWGGSRNWELRYGIVEPGADTLLSRAGEPVIVRQRVGAGSVTWSGLNLGYHADVNGSEFDRRLYAQLVVPDRQDRATESGRADSDQALITTGVGDSGAYFATNRYPNWHAQVDGRPAHVFEAGPGFMWVALPDDGQAHEVTWRYGPTGLEQAANVLSLAALGLTLAAAVAPLQRWRRATPAPAR